MIPKGTPLESEVQSKILDYLKARGVYHFKSVMANTSGVPDIICCHKGRFIGFEVKRSEHGCVQPLQWRHKQRIEDAGGEAYIVWSVEQVREVIESHDAG